MNRKQKKIDKRVDELVNDFLSSPYFNKDWEVQYDKLKVGITKLLNQKDKKLRERIEGMRKTIPDGTGIPWNKGYDQALSDLLKTLE